MVGRRPLPPGQRPGERGWHDEAGPSEGDRGRCRPRAAEGGQEGRRPEGGSARGQKAAAPRPQPAGALPELWTARGAHPLVPEQPPSILLLAGQMLAGRGSAALPPTRHLRLTTILPHQKTT